MQLPHDGGRASIGNGTHYGFLAPSEAAVRSFHAVALAHGGQDSGAPGPRPNYGVGYYGCFVIDPDGHRIEAMYWDETDGDDRE